MNTIRYTWLILSMFILSSFISDSSLINKEKNELINLFNGINLSGWTIHGTEKWYVENGELVCENGPDNQYGYLSTTEYYDDFILTLEFKQESNGNSGVFFRSTLEGVIINGWQVEIAPPGLFTGGIYESYGREWLIKPNPKDENLNIIFWIGRIANIIIPEAEEVNQVNGHVIQSGFYDNKIKLSSMVIAAFFLDN